MRGPYKFRRRPPLSDSKLQYLEQLSAPRLLYHETYNIIVGPPSTRPKFTDLPKEIQIEVMTHMNGEELQNLVRLLDMKLPKVVQYVVDTDIPKSKCQIETIQIDKLKSHYSRINLVHISSFMDLDVEAALQGLSMSINHIVISGLNVNISQEHGEQRERLTRFLNGSSMRTTITIADCEIVALENLIVDASRLKFRNIKHLELIFCSLDLGSSLETCSVDKLILRSCTKDLTGILNFTWGRPRCTRPFQETQQRNLQYLKKTFY
jgi:hypothetical protein